MTKKQKTILLGFAIVAIISFSGYLLRGCLHDPPQKESIDSLKYIKDQAKRRADLNGDSAITHKQKSDEAKILYNSPSDPSELEELWSRIEREAKADSSRKRLTR